MSFTALQRRVGNKMVARTAPIEDRSISARKNKALNSQGIYSIDKDILVGRFASIGKGMSIGYAGGRRGSLGQGGSKTSGEVLLDIRGKASRGTGMLITNHSSDGDSYITFKRFDTDALALSSSPWTVGIDGGDSDKFKICKGNAVGTNVALTIDDANLNVGIGTESPHALVILDLSSTTKAFRPPVMTTTERTAMGVGVAEGSVIYNTTTNVLNLYNGSGWVAV
jgi:hypothetical protein